MSKTFLGLMSLVCLAGLAHCGANVGVGGPAAGVAGGSGAAGARNAPVAGNGGDDSSNGSTADHNVGGPPGSAGSAAMPPDGSSPPGDSAGANGADLPDSGQTIVVPCCKTQGNYCGTSQCDSATEYCSVTFSGGQAHSSCQHLPKECAATTTCTCLDATGVVGSCTCYIDGIMRVSCGSS